MLGGALNLKTLNFMGFKLHICERAKCQIHANWVKYQTKLKGFKRDPQDDKKTKTAWLGQTQV
jgi:hypothetical protein